MTPLLSHSLDRFIRPFIALAFLTVAGCSTSTQGPVGQGNDSLRGQTAAVPFHHRTFNASVGGFEEPPPFGSRYNN